MDSPSDKAIVRLASATDIGGEIVRALGLPPVAELTIVFTACQPIEVVSTTLVREAEGEKLLAALTTAEYELRPVLKTAQDINSEIERLRARLVEVEVARHRAPPAGPLVSMPVRAAFADEIDRLPATHPGE
jgi:hypothetical protein